MKIEGATLDECQVEVKLLADFVRAQADELVAAWENLTKDTHFELHRKELARAAYLSDSEE